MSGIQIISAKYGAQGGNQDMVDVTENIKSKIGASGEFLNMRVSPASIGVTDPSPNSPKTLIVTYTLNGGTENTKTVLDGATLSIEVPGNSPKSGIGHAASAYAVLWTSVWGAGCVFVLVMTTAFAYQLGINGYSSWILLVIVALMMPYIGISGIVMVVLIHTAITGEFVAFKPVSFASKAASFASKGIRTIGDFARRARVAAMNVK